MQNINPNQKVDVVDLTKNFATDSKLTKKDLSKYIQTLIGTNPLNTKDKKALASFVKTSKRIGKKNVYIPDHIANSSKVEANNIDERKTAVNNITDLIQNAILIEISPNTNKKGKPNVDNYLRFYVPVKINNDIFTIRIVAENNSSKNLFNVLNADIYDLIIDKKMPTSVYIPANTQSNIVKSTSNNIVANNSQNINPAQITIKDMLSNVEDADGNIYFQSAVTAGAGTSAEISDAQKEWQEKGTDSKYFKKWFGDSKVVDENGQPLVAYHGTESNEAFSVFETNSPDGTPAIYFSSNKKVANSYSGNLPIYEVYLKMENPLEVDAQGKEYNDFAAEMRSNIDYANRNGYDGVIVKNIRDDWSQEKSGKVATTYVVFSPEQIKSVDNQGTFDESNPNIYYQTGINQGEITNIDGSIVKDVSNPLDYDYLNNQVTGEKVAIEINQDIKVEEIKPQNISSDLPFNVSKKTSENKKAIKQILNIDKGKILNLTNSATNESVEFKGTTIDESISKISINDGRYNDCCLILCNSKKLFETSQKILSHNDVKKVSDLKYSRYANIAQINDKQYLLEFVIKGKNKLALYSITPIKNDIAKRVDKSSQHDIAINSIAHIQDVFKSKIVQQYNNDYKNAYKNNNPKRTGYVFQEPAQPNLFVENAAQNHNKGFVGIDLKGNRGLTDINRNLILIGTTGDVTTVLHESAHYFLNMLEELERVPDHSPKVDDVLFAIRKTLKNDGAPFTRSQHEKFAKGFEHYIYTGNARSNIFKEIYEDIKNLLKNIYEFVQKGQYFTTGEGALTEEEMKNFNNVFDEIFKLENKTVKERVFAKVLALDEKEEDGFFKELTLFLSLFW